MRAVCMCASEPASQNTHSQLGTRTIARSHDNHHLIVVVICLHGLSETNSAIQQALALLHTRHVLLLLIRTMSPSLAALFQHTPPIDSWFFLLQEKATTVDTLYCLLRQDHPYMMHEVCK